MLQQEAGEVRTRERQRRVEESLEDLGKLWLDIVAEYWSDKRVIRNRKMLGGFEMFDFSKKDLAEWKYDIHVIPGSTTPLDTGGMMARVKELKNELGIQIPDEYVIRLSRLPGIESAMLETAKIAPTGEEAPAMEQEPMEQAPPPDEMAMQEAPPMPAPPMPTPEELVTQMQETVT
jgi:hypothetical protein